MKDPNQIRFRWLIVGSLVVPAGIATGTYLLLSHLVPKWEQLRFYTALSAGAIALWTMVPRAIASKRKIREVAYKAYQDRAALREEIVWHAANADDEWAWLLSTSIEQQHEWAIRRFRELVLEWPASFRRFEEMVKRENFPAALAEVSERAARLIPIWEARIALYAWARLNVRPVERVEANLSQQDQIARAKLERTDAGEELKRRIDALETEESEQPEPLEVTHGA